MARSYCRFRDITCSTCGTTYTIPWWNTGDAESQAPEWNEKKLLELRCECPTSAWQFPSSGTSSLTIHSTQGRSVVYELPDGDYMVPDLNTPDMIKTCEGVGVRRELNSLREVEKFRKEQMERRREKWEREVDEGIYEGTSLEPSFQQMQESLYRVARNNVLDYNEGSLKAGNDLTRQEIKERHERSEAAVNRFRNRGEKGMRIGKAEDRARYERLKREGR